jgi:[ribosomal protein S18]-alanine N-acetyltransferase
VLDAIYPDHMTARTQGALANITFTPMTEEQALMVTGWRYDPPYDFYNSGGDGDVLWEMIDPGNPYYIAIDESGEVIGFVSFKETARVADGYAAGGYADTDALDVGLGMRPDLTGQGRGLPFVLAVLEFARTLFNPASFRLSVATFNARANRVYERAGFAAGVVFTMYLDHTPFEFTTMTRLA